MITLTPERQNLWKNWIDNCFFILWTNQRRHTKSHRNTHSEREDKKCITGFELLLLISVALLPNLAGTHTNSLSVFDFFGIFSVVTPQSTSANRRCLCSVDLLTRSFSAMSWSTMLVLFLLLFPTFIIELVWQTCHVSNGKPIWVIN